jgi:hypothetical protein
VLQCERGRWGTMPPSKMPWLQRLRRCRLSSVVEQRFCKPLVGSSNLSAGKPFCSASYTLDARGRARRQLLGHPMGSHPPPSTSSLLSGTCSWPRQSFPRPARGVRLQSTHDPPFDRISRHLRSGRSGPLLVPARDTARQVVPNKRGGMWRVIRCEALATLSTGARPTL